MNAAGGRRGAKDDAASSLAPPPLPQGEREANIRREERGGGVWDPNVCAPKMARPNFPDGKFRFFATMITLAWGGGGGGSLPPAASGAELLQGALGA